MCTSNNPTNDSWSSGPETTANGQENAEEGGSLTRAMVTDSEQDAKDFTVIDPDLALALRLSQQEQQEYEQQRQREQQMLEEALKLSLQEH